jgi:hypothetical protein
MSSEGARLIGRPCANVIAWLSGLLALPILLGSFWGPGVTRLNDWADYDDSCDSWAGASHRGGFDRPQLRLR